jgi:hypothetical protein
MGCQAASEGGISVPDTEIRNVQVSHSEWPQDEPSVAVSRVDPRFVIVVANDYSRSETRTGLWRSTNGGRSFARRRLLRRPRGFDRSSDPVVDFVGRDRLLVAAVAIVRDPTARFSVREGSIVVWGSDDAGRTFDQPVIIARGRGTDIFLDKPALTVDKSAGSPYEGRAYVAYTVLGREFAPGMIVIQRSDDGGRSWSEPVTLTPSDRPVQGASIATGRDGQVYVSWIEHDSRTAGRFHFRRSGDGGATFGESVTVAEIRLLPICRAGLASECLPVPGWRFRTGTFSFLGADISDGPAAGTIYAVWPEFRHDRAGVWLARSRNEGDTWSDPIHVSGDGDAIFPNIAVSPDTGEVHIVYVGNELSPPPGTLMDLFVAEAPPGGRRFRRRQVSSESFDPNADPFFGEPTHFIGDYIGIDVLPGGGFLTAWMDTRTGTQAIFAGIAPGDADR